MARKSSNFFWALLCVNVLLSFIIVFSALSKSARDVARTEVVTRVEPVVSAGKSTGLTKPESADVVRDRIEQKLRAALLAKFKASFETQDPQERRRLNDARTGIFNTYSVLFHQLNLNSVQLNQLVELMVQRSTVTTYYVTLPQDVIDAGVSKSFTFGADPVDSDIQNIFGSDVLQQVKSFESELPYFNARNQLCDYLKLSGINVQDNQAAEIQAAFRNNPLPAKPSRAATESDWENYNNARLKRVDQILAAVSTTLGNETSSAVNRFLLDKEEIALSIRQNSQAAKKNSSNVGSAK